MNFEDIKNLGRGWRSEFPNLEFLGQIEVGQEQLKELCPAVGKYLGATWNEDVCTALAVAVVNIAYYEPEADHDSFRWQVLERLARPQDNRIWEEEIGRPIEKLLVKYFDEGQGSGPYRYVALVLRQAGIPRRSVAQFAGFVHALMSQLGWQFSERQYMEFCETRGIPSRILSEFLPTETGWRFCQAIARVFRNRKDGITSVQEALTLPGFRGEVLESLWECFSGTSIQRCSQDLRRPRVVLDLDSLRLMIDFSEQGIPGGYIWDGKKVYSARCLLEGAHFEGPLQGRIIHPGGDIEEWRLAPWNPDDRPWAIFGISDTVLQLPKHNVNPGRYWLAIPDSCKLEGVTILEERGYLYHPASSLSNLRVLDCELPPGLCIPEIGLTVSKGSTSKIPRLAFAKTAELWPCCQHVFVGRLPDVQIVNWTPEFATQYALILERGNSRTKIDEVNFRTQASFKCYIAAPTMGRICLEAKGIEPREFEPDSLPFVLLSQERLSWPMGLREEDEEVAIAVQPGKQFDVNWRQPGNIRKVSDGEWLVPGRVDYVEGSFSFDGDSEFRVSGPVYRFRAIGDCVDDGILWREELEKPTKLRLAFSPQEKGLHPELGIASRDGFKRLLQLPKIPSHGQLEVSTDSIRDAFLGYRRPCGLISVCLPNGKVVRSPNFYANESEIVRLALDKSDPAFEEWACDLPRELYTILADVRRIRTEPNAGFSFQPLGWPDCLDTFFKEICVCSRVFDGDASVRELSNLALRELLDWFITAREFVEQNQSFNEAGAAALMQVLPNDISILAFARWQEQFEAVKSKVVGIKDFLRSVRAWAGLCRSQRWEDAKAALLGQMRGGVLLTDAARSYYYALKRVESGPREEVRDWLAGTLQKLEAARREAQQGVVWQVASALRIMIFFHDQHALFQREQEGLVLLLGKEWQRLKWLLNALAGHLEVEKDGNDSLGLGDITPHPYDLQLEERIIHGQRVEPV